MFFFPSNSVLKVLVFLTFFTKVYCQNLNLTHKPRLYYPQSFFNPKLTKESLKLGKATIKGQAFAIDNMDGSKHYASNSTVILIPYTTYLNEWLKLNAKYKGTNSSVYLKPEVFELRLETITDQYGNFSFTDLKPGKYYLECIVNFQAKALGSSQSGNIVTYNGYGVVLSTTPTYEYYTYKYDTQKRAYKIVTVSEEKYLYEVNLKPAAPVPFVDLEKISAIGVSSTCYRQENLQFGTCTEYFEDGTIKAISNWRKDVLDGKYIEYFNNGKTRYEGEYKNGLKINQWQYYHENSDKLRLTENYKYKDGMNYLEGQANFYDLNGKLKESDYYLKNKLHGLSTTYFANGKVKDTLTYNNGILQGKAIYYDENGKVIKEEFYKDGKPN